MQQFVVPQFIDVEDKILGPVTVRQFLIMLVAGLLIFVAYRLADTSLFIVFSLTVGGIALMVAFGKYNGQNFHYVLLNFIQYLRNPSQRVWWKEYSKKELDFLRKYGTQTADLEASLAVKKEIRREHISNLALIVNTGGYYKAEDFE